MPRSIGVDITRVDTTPQFALGELYSDDTNKKYKYVQYDTGAGSVAAVVGNVTYYYTADGYDNNQVTSDLSDSVGLGSGVLLSTPADGEYCWIQIRGAAVLNLALTGTVDGGALTAVGATDGTLDISALVTDAICAFATDGSEKKIACAFVE